MRNDIAYNLAVPLFIAHSIVWWTWVEQNLWGTMVFVTLGVIAVTRRRD